uniref:Uncharacterized protein n=1 Tax=Parastrongyloides trichosuri TaxID=131310 RepID=A0A0N4ZYK7_PARTI
MYSFNNKTENHKNETYRLLKITKYGENDEIMVLEFDHTLYIPFLLFIFTLPIIVITILCFLRQRNRRLVSREIERINNRRFSTTSGLYNGTVSSTQNNTVGRYRSTRENAKTLNVIDGKNSLSIDNLNKTILKMKDVKKSPEIITIKGTVDL